MGREDAVGSITGDGTAVQGLGGSAGFGEFALPRGDDVVARVDVSAVFERGLTLGGVLYAADALYVSTDGLISFGAPVAGVVTDASAIAAPFFAIFHGDVDTRLDGEGAESGRVWLDVDTVQDCVTITWDHVGFYRRNAARTDTVQIQLFDRGNGGFDVVYRYQDISWTSGDLQGGSGGLGGVAALIGHRVTAGGAATFLAASGNQAAELALATTLGNTGVAGLWVWSYLAPALIIGTAAADTLTGTSRDDTMRGREGADVLMGSAGADVLDGGAGGDRADYGSAPSGIRIDLATPARNLGFAQGDSFVFVESLVGSGFADTLLGAAAGDRFFGADGADVLYGRDGNDILSGGAAADRLWGEGGDDLLYGGTGNDTLYGHAGNDRLTGGPDADLLVGGGGQDTLFGSAGADSLYGGDEADLLWGGGGGPGQGDLLVGGGGNDTLLGRDRHDRLVGDAGADRLWGMAGDDGLWGGAGDDVILGAAGADTLRGGDGNDTLAGGPGLDRLTGGPGADTFRHNGAAGQGGDLVTDFDPASGDLLAFAIAGAAAAEFSVSFAALADVGHPGLAEAMVTYLPTGRVIFVLVDGAGLTSIPLQSSANTFDLL